MTSSAARAFSNRIVDMHGRAIRTQPAPARRIENYFEAAQFTGERSTLMLGPDYCADELGWYQRQTLLRKARYWDKNSALVNRLCDLFVNHVVGSSLRVTPASADDDWNARAARWWSRWETVADLTSDFTWAVLQRLMARELILAGEYFLALTSSPDSGRNRVQFVQPCAVRTPEGRERDPRVIDGVEVNEWGRPVAYFVHEPRAQEERSGKQVYRRIEARWMVHGFEPVRAGQVRGITQFAPVLNDIHDLEDLQKLEQQAARDNAQITRIIKTESGEVDDEEAIIQGETDSVDRATYYRRVFGAGAETMLQGDDMQEFRSERPSVAVREYWIWLTNKVCAGVNIPSQIVFPESLNGTVTRAVLDLANSHFRGYTQLIALSTQRVWNYVIGNSIEMDAELSGAPEDWGRIKIHPPRAVNVDVGRNSTAMINEYRAGMRTLAGIYAETGQDWQAELRQKADELAFAKTVAEERGLDASDLLESIEPEEDPAEVASRAIIDQEDEVENAGTKPGVLR